VAIVTEFAEHGPDGTTMARIAERAGIKKERRPDRELRRADPSATADGSPHLLSSRAIGPISPISS
jgi:hypothetical protein